MSSENKSENWSKELLDSVQYDGYAKSYGILYVFLR